MMKARKPMVGYDNHAAPIAWALVVYFLVISVLVGAGFAALSPNQFSYGDFYTAFQDAIRSLVSLFGLG